jgi:hypothetical protein
MVGTFNLMVLVALAVPGALLLWRILPDLVRVAGPRTSRSVWFLALAIATSAAIWNLSYSAELVITGRDGGTYANTAKGLLTWGELLPRAVEAPFDGPSDLGFEAPGFVLREDGRLYQQFLHASPAVFAAGGLVAGSAGMWGANALVGGAALLMFFGLARSFVTPWLALAVQASLALCLPFVYFSRATFSEPLTLFFVVSGLWAANAALDERSQRVGVGAGLLLGGAALARIDGWIVLVGITTAGLVALVVGDSDDVQAQQRVFTSIWTSAMSVGALGMIDGILFSTPYISRLGPRLVLLMGAGLVIELVRRSLLRVNLDNVRRRLANLKWIGLVLSAVVLALSLYAAFIRPYIVEVQGNPYGLEIVGDVSLPADSTRTFHERSLWWLSWYLGPSTVALAVVGTALVVHRLNRGLSTSLLLTAVIVIQSAVLYLWRPSINPDHIWASRRFLPIVIPGALLMAGIILSRLSIPDRGRSHVATALFGSTLVLGAAVPTLPSWDLAESRGADELMYSICGDLPEEAAVLIVDTPLAELSVFLAQPVRAWWLFSSEWGLAGSDAGW